MARPGRARGWIIAAGMLALPACCPARRADAAEIRFRTDVVPILTRQGCNSGGCHGKAAGQNGFRLSLLGFEPESDYAAVARDAGGRRLVRGDPDRSLLLLKASGAVPHGGGRQLARDSEPYRIIREWIAAGAPPPAPGDPRVLRLEITPPRHVFSGGARQLQATARFSDGTSRDVTREAVYQSNEPEIASVDGAGRVAIGGQKGLFTVMARFGDQVAAFHGAVPLVSGEKAAAAVRRRLDALAPALEASPVDRHLLRQWRRLSVAPSPPADDAAFLRRVTLDICGTLPTPEEVQAFLADRRSDRRARLVDRLLERPEYAGYFALKWADILQNRGAGYSTTRQRAGTSLFAGWIRASIAANKPYDRFAAEILTASGSQNENPPAVWYRSVRKPPEFVESVASAFLGVRLQCAQCHHHPAERWSQDDYYGLAAVFARVGRKGGFADAEVPTDEILYLKEDGFLTHPRTGRRVAPRPPGGPDLALGRYDDPRESFARWLTRSDNPYFARTMANRMWAHFLGRGLVHPIDDARSTNPPSNPELLDALAREFAAGGYDVKRLIRLIVNSHAYGLQSGPVEENAADTQTFARFYPRRLGAEVLLDGISQVLDVPTEFPGGPGKFPAGTRAIDLPDENVTAPFLDVFGRPARRSACECERGDAPALAQALELVSSAEIQRKLAAENGYARRLAAGSRPPGERAAEAFVRVLARPARPDELRAAAEFLASEPDPVEACRSLLWSLLATHEFLFNH